MLRKDLENPSITLEKLLKREEAAGGDVHHKATVKRVLRKHRK